MKKLLLILCISILPAQAFEDCVVSADGKLSDISIEKNDIIDVYPIFTIMNEKNQLYVHPLKEGKTRFCVLKNGKEIVMFNVEVNVDNTVIDEVEGFEIFSVDTPPHSESSAPLEGEVPAGGRGVFEQEVLPLDFPPLDLPPGGSQWTN